MLRKVFIVGGAVAGAVIGYLRTAKPLDDVFWLFWGICVGAFLAYLAYDFVASLANEE